MTEYSILKSFLKDKNLYNKYNNKISNIKTEREIGIVFKLIEDYYNRYEDHNYISIDELKTFFKYQYPSVKNPEVFDIIFQNIIDCDTSDSLAADIIRQYIEKDFVNQIVNKCLPVLSGENSGVIPSIENLLSEFRTAADVVEDEEESPFVEGDLEDLIENETNGNILHWRLACLNNDIGPIGGGGLLGHVYARPDTGKTTFLASEGSHLAGQLGEGECAVWFNIRPITQQCVLQTS